MLNLALWFPGINKWIKLTEFRIELKWLKTFSQFNEIPVIQLQFGFIIDLAGKWEGMEWSLIEWLMKLNWSGIRQEERISEFEWNERMNGNYRLNEAEWNEVGLIN